MKRILYAAVSAMTAALLMFGCGKVKKMGHLPYPDTRRDTTVVEDYFGTGVADPYRWLEDDNSAETAAWVEAQNAVTRDYLDRLPGRQAIQDRLTQLSNYPKEGAPARHGEYYYYFFNDGLQNQSALWRKRSLAAPGELFLDPNTLSADGTTALIDVSFSNDGRWCAYAAAESGSDWVKIHVLDTRTGEPTGDVIEWVKFSGAAWAADSQGFYYSAYDAPKSSVYSSKNEYQKVYYHRLGTTQAEDRLVYGDPEHPLRYFNGWEPTSVNGSDPKYSVSAIIPKSDTASIEAITSNMNQAEIMNAYESVCDISGDSIGYILMDGSMLPLQYGDGDYFSTIAYFAGYSHDNYGGLVLICDSGKERSYSLGKKNSTLRYNISINDGIRPKPTRQGMFSPSLHIAGCVENTKIEHNIIHANPKQEQSIDRSMIVSDNWDGYADHTTFSQNIFYAAEPSRFNLTHSTNNVFNGNWYIGTYANLPDDPESNTACPLYEKQILTAGSDGYLGLKSLMTPRDVHGTTFLFVDKERIEAFFNQLD